MSSFHVSFPGGVAVDAEYRGHVVHTDQPAPYGTDTAMSPFDLFLASMATCMGFYAVRFCQERQIAIEGLGVTLTPERDRETKQLTNVRVELTLPDALPEKYRDTIVRAVDQCAVKKALMHPPTFAIDVITSAAPATP